MAFLYSDQQRAIGEEARRQLSARFDGSALRRILDAGAGYDADFWRICGQNYWTGITIGRTMGGWVLA